MREFTMRRKWYFIAPAAIVGIIVFIFVGGEVVMRLWNWLLPSLFGWHQLTFWEALGMLALCRILFGGFSSQGMSRSRMRQRMAGRAAARVTPEQGEQFRQRMRDRCGFDPGSAESKGETAG
jgi:hypothetical protein